MQLFIHVYQLKLIPPTGESYYDSYNHTISEQVSS